MASPAVMTDGAADTFDSHFTYPFLRGVDTTSRNRPRMVTVPREALDQMANMERQYWEIKSRHFDVVIFFKKGKFYELYDCDAVIGSREFSLKMTSDTTNRGKMRMAGVPEQSFSEWARLFVFKGYKVGRVEQMVAGGVAEDDGEGEGISAPAPGRTSSSKTQCIPRDLVQILTRGTVVDPCMLAGPDALWVMAIAVVRNANDDENGACVIDAVAYDASCGRLLNCPCSAGSGTTPEAAVEQLCTLLQQLRPTELVLREKSPRTPHGADRSLEGSPRGAAGTDSVKVEAGAPPPPFAPPPLSTPAGMAAAVDDVCEAFAAAAGASVERILVADHAKAVAGAGRAAGDEGAAAALRAATTGGPTAASLLLSYMQYLKVSAVALQDLFPCSPAGSPARGARLQGDGEPSSRLGSALRRETYELHLNPSSRTSAGGGGGGGGGSVAALAAGVAAAAAGPPRLLDLEGSARDNVGLFLDAAAIENLELLANLKDGTAQHSMFARLCHACSPGGRRLFRAWMLRPPTAPALIAARSTAVHAALLRGPRLLDVIRRHLGRATAGGLGRSPGGPALSPGGGSDDVAVSGQLSSQASAASAASGAAGSHPPLVGTDLERCLARLSDLKAENANIVFADPLVLYQRNLGTVLSTLAAFGAVLRLAAAIRDASATCAAATGGAFSLARSAPLLDELTTRMEGAAPAVAAVRGLFDVERAHAEHVAAPTRGAVLPYDAAVDEGAAVEAELAARLLAYKRHFGPGHNVSFTDIGKELRLVEVSLGGGGKAPANIPADFTERARTMKALKFAVGSLSELVDRHKAAEAARKAALVGVLRAIAGRFCDFFPALFAAAQALAYVDCLASLAEFASTPIGVCVPTVVADGPSAFVHARGVFHPFLDSMLVAGPSGAGSVVANDVFLGAAPAPDEQGGGDASSGAPAAASGRVLLLTGPNMAGKSTLMRTVALATIMAQMGGVVCAASFHFSPVTRIFTRIGARDATQLGRSTLFVELHETAQVLAAGDGRSLCLIDELGRGTATHDGYAIAAATLRALGGLPHGGPLTLFSTHYHALAIDVLRAREAAARAAAGAAPARGGFDRSDGRGGAAIQLGFMDFVSDATSCAESGAEVCATPPAGKRARLEAAPSQTQAPASGTNGGFTFLYRLVPGVCNRSFGCEVARRAGISNDVIALAVRRSRWLSATTQRHQMVDVLADACRAAALERGDPAALAALATGSAGAGGNSPEGARTAATSGVASPAAASASSALLASAASGTVNDSWARIARRASAAFEDAPMRHDL